MTITSNYFDNFIKKKLTLRRDVFTPNLTSRLSYETANQNIAKNTSVLDLGCGSGVIGILIKKNKKIKLYCSDTHLKSVVLTKKNLKKNKISAVVKQGNLFKPWNGLKFDYIINDVSAISSLIASKSKWFSTNIPSNCGKDGTNLSIKVIKYAKKFLNKRGILQLPLLSLSDIEKVKKEAKKNFSKINITKSENWFLPDDLIKFKTTLLRLKKQKKISFEEKFGKIICQTSVLICKL